MGQKQKGSNAERELVHLFWSKGMAACRVAGSGSMRYPSPDVLASNGAKLMAIECKYSTENSKYIPLEDAENLLLFARRFNAIPLIGIRFSNTDWKFLHPAEIESTGKFLLLKRSSLKGFSFEEVCS